VQRVARIGLAIVEIAILSALILATRFANYQDVFVAGNVYFSDADCYARMTRVRICEKKPGLIVRHHDFENFPQGTTPHTTAPFDYLILALAVVLKPFTAHGIDLAGALISPLLALFGGWFLWWWSRRIKVRYRWAALILYGISPVLVKGTELGRPDHQSLLILLITVAICAEWTLQFERSTKWGIVSGMAWSFALWVSLYEPLILLFLVAFLGAVQDRRLLFGKQRRAGWILFAVIVALALAIERRIPSFSIFHSGELFENRARTIGELARVWPANPIWLRWGGYLLLVAPFLIWFGVRKREVGAPGGRTAPIFVLALLVHDLLADDLAGTLGVFFLSDFCDCASGFARADQIARGGLDRFYVVDISDPAGLGHTTLARRSGIHPADRTAERICAVARTGNRFAIVRDAPVSCAVVAFASDRLLVGTAWCGRKLAREPVGNRGQRALLSC